MPSVINSDDGVVSGTSGLKTTGGNDGILVFQKNGTETARINTDSQIVTVAGTVSLPPIAPTGDLNTGIYFPGADRVGFSTGGSQRGEFDASGNFQFNSGYGSVATAYGCRAWVNFNGNGVVAIRASGNVSSITDNGVGNYTVNLANALPDTNAGVLVSAGGMDTGVYVSYPTLGSYNSSSNFILSTSQVRVYQSSPASGNSTDPYFYCVAIFR